MSQLRKTSRSFTRRSAMVAAVALAFVGSAHANLLVDGDFEGDAGHHPNNSNYGSGNVNGIPGWTVQGTLAQNVQWIKNGTYASITAYDGVGLIDLTGTDTYGPGGVSQTLTTVVGAAYQATFHIGYGNPASLFGGPVSVQVSTDDVQNPQTFVVVGPGTADQSSTIWTEETYAFTATSTSTLLRFDGVAGLHFLGLDGIDVERLPDSVGGSAVPEPAAIALLGLGILGGAFARRRRSFEAKRP